MDSELDQVLGTILSLEEDYAVLVPTLVDQETSTNGSHLSPGLISSVETQQDLQYSDTLKKTLLEIYNLIGIQRQQVQKNMDPKKIGKIPASSSTLDNVSSDGFPASSKRKSCGKENEVYKKARIENHEMKATDPNNRCRKRTNYSREQIAFLMSEFDRNPYPDFTSRCWIGRLTGISEPRIQVWFQNRRARHFLKPSKSDDDSQHRKSTETEKICTGYNENPSNLPLYGEALAPDTTWILSDLASILY